MLAFADDTTVSPYRAPFAEPDDPHELTEQTLAWLKSIDWAARITWGDEDGVEIEPGWLVLWVGELDPHVTSAADYAEEATVWHQAPVDGVYPTITYCTVHIECTRAGPWLVIHAAEMKY